MRERFSHGQALKTRQKRRNAVSQITALRIFWFSLQIAGKSVFSRFIVCEFISRENGINRLCHKQSVKTQHKRQESHQFLVPPNYCHSEPFDLQCWKISFFFSIHSTCAYFTPNGLKKFFHRQWLETHQKPQIAFLGPPNYVYSESFQFQCWKHNFFHQITAWELELGNVLRKWVQAFFVRWKWFGVPLCAS